MRKAASMNSLLVAGLFISACSTQAPVTQTQMAPARGPTSIQNAEVTNVRDVTTAGGRQPGIGSVVGGVLGGLAGSAIGNGWGRTAATVGGGIAGTVAGHEIEKAGATASITEVTVRLDDGSLRTLNLPPGGNFRIGEKITLVTEAGGRVQLTRN
jgi:outer membrane lipoprotein SlyB